MRQINWSRKAKVNGFSHCFSIFSLALRARCEDQYPSCPVQTTMLSHMNNGGEHRLSMAVWGVHFLGHEYFMMCRFKSIKFSLDFMKMCLWLWQNNLDAGIELVYNHKSFQLYITIFLLTCDVWMWQDVNQVHIIGQMLNLYSSHSWVIDRWYV